MRDVQARVALEALTAAVEAEWGSAVDVVKDRGSRVPGRPSIWPSDSQPGALGICLPRELPAIARNLQHANAIFEREGIRRPLSDGKHIGVAGRRRPEFLHELERRHGIAITPLKLRGREIAYLMSRKDGLHSSVLLCARTEASHDTFDKPSGIEIAYAAPRGTVPRDGPLEFARLLKEGDVRIPRPQVWGYRAQEIPNHPVFGIPLQFDAAAQFVGAMVQAPGVRDFDLIVPNRQAEHVTLADLLQAISDTMNGWPSRVVCHFTRDAP